MSPIEICIEYVSLHLIKTYLIYFLDHVGRTLHSECVYVSSQQGMFSDLWQTFWNGSLKVMNDLTVTLTEHSSKLSGL